MMKNYISLQKDVMIPNTLKKKLESLINKFIDINDYLHEFLNCEEITKLINLENKRIKQAQNLLGMNLYRSCKSRYNFSEYEFGIIVSKYEQQISKGVISSDLIEEIKHKLGRPIYDIICEKFTVFYSNYTFSKIKKLISNEENVKNNRNSLLSNDKNIENLAKDYNQYYNMQYSTERKKLRKKYTFAVDIIKKQYEKYGYIEVKICRKNSGNQVIGGSIIMSFKITDILLAINNLFFYF